VRTRGWCWRGDARRPPGCERVGGAGAGTRGGLPRANAPARLAADRRLPGDARRCGMALVPLRSRAGGSTRGGAPRVDESAGGLWTVDSGSTDRSEIDL